MSAYNFAYLDEQTKRMIRRAVLKAVAVPGYQVPFSAQIRKATGMPTMAVGLITEPEHAEAIVAEGQADMVALARAFLDDPHWGWRAAYRLGANPIAPVQYQRATLPTWPPAKKYVPMAKAAE